jgi:hypothetical protein
MNAAHVGAVLNRAMFMMKFFSHFYFIFVFDAVL